MPHERPAAEADASHGKRFAYIAAGVCALVSFLPYLYGLMVAPVGQTYLGYQYNTDDHMVYSAWMRQAADGNFFFDNRFAVDAQPGLTVHIYFFVLGLLSKVSGLPLAAALAKAFFSGFFVLVLYRFLLKLEANNFFVKLALSVSVVGGGLGFFVWHRFGEAFLPTDSHPLQGLMLTRLPVDVWQPEAFVFPSMLTNGLFMVSLSLIVGLFWCVLEARESWRPVPFGFVWMAVLMNIHSYDVLLVGLVLAGFLVVSLVSRTASLMWIVRVLAMTLGVIGPALWFRYVYQNDPVFQARAATDTFSPNFRQVFFGLFFMLALALFGVLRGLREDSARKSLRIAGSIGIAVGVVVLFGAAGAPSEGFWLGSLGWCLLFGGAVLLSAILATPSPGWNLIVCWALVGLAAVYFPALFQRKLSMGISVPWAILASVGLWKLSTQLERGTRNLVAALAILVLSGTSVRWFLREGEFIRDEVSRTTLHPVFLTDDSKRILDHLNNIKGRKVVLAMPGIASPFVVNGEIVPDRFKSPYLPDMNAIASGLTGAYTYAGHWSETPDYLKRRNDATRFFLTQMTDRERLDLIRSVGITHVIAPVPESYPEFFELTKYQLADLSGLGGIVVDGSQFRLIEVDGG